MLEQETKPVRHVPVTGPESYSQEWYDVRQYNPDRKIPVVIGASEAAAACNQSPYSSALLLKPIAGSLGRMTWKWDRLVVFDMTKLGSEGAAK